MNSSTTLPARFPGRKFSLWSYSVSHGQLLLRSTRSDRHTGRVEILFKDVARLDLPTLIEDLQVELATEHALPPSATQLGSWERWDRNTYLVRGVNCVGYVVAGSVFYREDDGEYYSPSGLFDQFIGLDHRSGEQKGEMEASSLLASLLVKLPRGIGVDGTVAFLKDTYPAAFVTTTGARVEVDHVVLEFEGEQVVRAFPRWVESSPLPPS